MTQEEALDIMMMGKNVFLTGPAGSGKTFVLNQYIKYLKKHKINMAITASTGIAATNMNGKTIHSWAHIGIKNDMTEAEINRIFARTDYRMQMMSARVLIIDEISMLHHYRLDLVDKILRRIHDNDLPFGGIQVILCGDLFQLPPITPYGQEIIYINESSVWKDMDIHICYLTEQFRQEDDSLISILNEIRLNEISTKSMELLSSRFNKSTDQKNITKLYTHNADVDSINKTELSKLPGKIHKFTMFTKGDQFLAKNLSDNCLAPAELELKVGATVMFVQNNYKQGYVNGTIGTVHKFDSETTFPIIKLKNGKNILAAPGSWRIEEGESVLAEITQVPLRLAWAITVHKSQGMTLDNAEIDLSKSFSSGMGYVALSRIKSLDTLNLIGLNNNALKVNDKIIEFDKSFRDQSKKNLDLLRAHGHFELRKLKKQFISDNI